MGLVKQRELKNGNVDLEIIYGGIEAPFGGVDTSAPPAYIDPRCAAFASGFLVIDNKLVAVSFQPAYAPELWNGVSGVILLKVGTMYNSLTGQLNYALGYRAESFVGPPSGVNYTFYITSWQPNGTSTPTVYNTDVLPISLYDAVAVQQQASLTLDCIASQVAATALGSGASGTVVTFGGKLQSLAITGGIGYGVGDIFNVVQGSNLTGWGIVTSVTGSAISTANVFNQGTLYTTGAATAGSTESHSLTGVTVVGPSGTFTYGEPSYAQGYTRQQIVAAIVAGAVGAPDVTLSSSSDGYSLVITANEAGSAGNAITVQDASTSEVAGNTPPFYFSALTPRNLEGGQIAENAQAPRQLNSPASTTMVGGTLYIANVGPMILKFSGPGQFTTSTMYNGVGIIKKFGGSMIGLRLQNQLGVYTQNQDMIWAWTSGEDLDEWAPVNTTGNVTGAGFEQIADIGDYLSGLLVSNGTAFIIRAQGISYASESGNATLPFPINHIGLGDSGEGAQLYPLVCQYDQTGAFVGNSDIFQISGSISSIGQKIKSALFASLQAGVFSGQVLSSEATSVYLGDDKFPLVAFSVGPFTSYPNTGTSFGLAFYFFNPSNGTWMEHLIPSNFPGLSIFQVMFGTFSLLNNYAISSTSQQSSLALALQTSAGETLQAPNLYQLVEGVPNENGGSQDCPSILPFIYFPIEEVAFGKDITVDALYVSIQGAVTAGTIISFTLIGLQPSSTDPTIYTQVSQAYATIVLEADTFTSVENNPIELQVNNFSGQVSATGAFTAKAVQLLMQITPLTETETAQVRITKIAMHASYDPTQRPV